MPAERAGYTVTMFLIDVSASMGKTRLVDLSDGPNGEPRTAEMTNLEWALQFVKLKIQEMIYHGRKTEQCGVILFGAEGTKNMINERSGGYDHVLDYIEIAQPDAGTLAKLSELEPTQEVGDPIDALVVGIETQRAYLANKRTWTKKIVLLTDGENPIEVEDWETIVEKMNTLDIIFTIIGVDFDDDELSFYEEDKSTIKKANEDFFHKFVAELENGIVGTCALALREISRPDVKSVKSTLMGSILRLGDVDVRPEEAIEVVVKYSKCTAMTRPKGFKKFGKRKRRDSEAGDPDQNLWVELKMQTQYVLEEEEEDSDVEMKDGEKGDKEGEDEKDGKKKESAPLDKETLQRGFKYGATYVLCPDGSFPKLETRRGIDIAGFFKKQHFRRDHAIGEVYYVWADPSSPQQQVAFSSIVQAMYEKDVMAIARWVNKDGADVKMGVLAPNIFEKVDCLLWVQMPFADDVRKYTFASLDNLITKSGEQLVKHPYLPTTEQLDAMDRFVDAMDLMDAGDKDEDGNRMPWFDTTLSYNPAVHRVKQALFHSAVVSDLTTNPFPPPHPELLKYFDPPRRVLKRARSPTEECKTAFNVKEVPKKIFKERKDGHVRAHDEDEDTLLLDKLPRRTQSQSATSQTLAPTSSQKLPDKIKEDSGSETEDDDERMLLDQKVKPSSENEPELPTPRPESQSPELNAGREPGRIIGRTNPLEDFRKNLVSGDLVSKAVEDLGWVIKDVVGKPFAGRRTGELVECLKEMREVCLKEDEIDTWNEFIQDLKDACLEEFPGNAEFWDAVRKLGRDISLISKPEARQFAGKSGISEALAKQFIES